MNIYLAAPLFSEAEKRFNIALCNKLEYEGYNVFLPQRDGVEKGKFPYKTMDKDERRKTNKYV